MPGPGTWEEGKERCGWPGEKKREAEAKESGSLPESYAGRKSVGGTWVLFSFF